MAFQFPPNPTIGQEYPASAGLTFRWNGTAWYLINTQYITKNDADALYIALTEKAAADGVATLGVGGQIPNVQLVNFGCQLRLDYVSPLICQLNGVTGRYLPISGTLRDGLGAQLDTTGFATNTVLYIYASWNGSAVALEAAPTVPDYAASGGYPTKTGDPARTLVGILRTDGSSQILVNTANQNIASYYHRKRRALHVTGPTASFSNTAIAEIDSATRCGWCGFADAMEQISVMALVTNDTAPNVVNVAIGIDGSSTNVFCGGTPPDGNAQVNASATIGFELPEGWHFGQVMAVVSGTTGSFITGPRLTALVEY
jgi:hypothetical protein